MLHKLIEYGERHEIHGEEGFSCKRVRWLLNFSSSGKYLGLVEQTEPEAKPGVGRQFFNVPHLKFAGDTTMRQFLVDTTQYALLYGEAADDEKIIAKHRFFLKLLHDAANADPFLAKVANALADERVRENICRDLHKQTPKAKTSDNVTFAEISGTKSRIIVNDDTWQKWWRVHYPTLFKERESVSPMLCLVSGEMCDPARTHPKIKGIGRDVGGKEETTLVGYNLDAFCSYGLKQSSNAAIKPEITEQYAAALNELIARHSYRLTGTKVVHWYAGNDEVPNELDPLSWLWKEPDEESLERVAQSKAQSLLDSIRSGGRSDILNYRYYSMTLSGSSARVMVRDWIDGQFGELVTNIDAWFNDLAVVRRDGDRLAPRPKFLAVLGGLVRELKDMPSPVETKMWRVAVRNEPIPEFAMAKALARTKIDIVQDKPMNHARMGLLKAYHKRKGDIDMQPYLNEDHPNSAYHCGRLMAVYADLQRAALGDVGAGVVQRYYAAASATPALILGRLSRGGQFHLNKLDGGLAFWYQQRLASIWGRIKDAPPKTLTLEEQSLFALGYYHQIAAPKKVDKNQPTEITESKGEKS
jgi:CRISPR-associated protein Csd1